MGSESCSSSDEKKLAMEPLLGDNLNPKGGLRTMPFIIANEAFERVASIGLQSNMIMYLTREYNLEAMTAAYILFVWSAVSNLMPVLGAFVADSYAGRYRMVGFGSIATLAGMVLLWLTAIIPSAKPPVCDPASEICERATTSQLLFLYSSLGFMSVGAGGIRSSSLAFGADQLNREDSIENAGILQRYFSWYYAAVSVASMVAVTCIVYIQDNLGWKVGLGVPAVLMFLSALSFFLASPFYVKLKAKTSLLTGLAQVIVASYRNRNVKLSSQATDEVYHHKKGSMLLKPSEKLRWLNKACIVRDPLDLTSDGRAKNPWNLCTVDQVEELKALIKVIPLWSTGIVIGMTLDQQSFPIIQVSTMDRKITSNFEIPSGSFGIFMIITVIVWIALYEHIIIPIASKISGKPTYLSLKKRLGIGLLCSCASMATWAIVEIFRRKIAIEEGFSDDPRAVVHMSWMWLLPHLVLGGLAMAFNTIGQSQFYYSELPKSMASISSTLLGIGSSAASLVSSFIVNTVDNITKSGGKESWISTNINKGHYDYYYWLLAGLSMVNFMYFLVCSKAYGPCKGEAFEKDDMSTEEQ
ncbi:protein NRT1/ PTR FAMILY 1.2-like [Mangifera indica]|uniref:protein NRT1/ PTR FAMILY 1.2-like n=1 Tax=Mangifera indica TaxID=29780 RepID=UPI001CFB869F|nr:protein NRT1/ PTR FAMILY 1.2-like [Mangifera indica]